MALSHLKFDHGLFVPLRADKEFLAQKSAPHRDFYNVRKVDTHVHHRWAAIIAYNYSTVLPPALFHPCSACMRPEHLPPCYRAAGAPDKPHMTNPAQSAAPLPALFNRCSACMHQKHLPPCSSKPRSINRPSACPVQPPQRVHAPEAPAASNTLLITLRFLLFLQFLQRVHAPEAPAALHQEQAAEGAGRGGHLQVAN